LEDGLHAGTQALLRDLNALYKDTPALYGGDAIPGGFTWVIGDDDSNSVFAFLRHHAGQVALAVSNMTPIPRDGYRIGVPVAGQWSERLNTDGEAYGGSNMGNQGAVHSEPEPSHGYEQSLLVTLPPLATVIFIADGSMP